VHGHPFEATGETSRIGVSMSTAARFQADQTGGINRQEPVAAFHYRGRRCIARLIVGARKGGQECYGGQKLRTAEPPIMCVKAIFS